MIGRWVQRDITGRGSYTAHLVTGRKAACGAHLGYGGLRAAWSGARRCQTCVRVEASR